MAADVDKIMGQQSRFSAFSQIKHVTGKGLWQESVTARRCLSPVSPISNTIWLKLAIRCSPLAPGTCPCSFSSRSPDHTCMQALTHARGHTHTRTHAHGRSHTVERDSSWGVWGVGEWGEENTLPCVLTELVVGVELVVGASRWKERKQNTGHV